MVSHCLLCKSKEIWAKVPASTCHSSETQLPHLQRCGCWLYRLYYDYTRLKARLDHWSPRTATRWSQRTDWGIDGWTDGQRTTDWWMELKKQRKTKSAPVSWVLLPRHLPQNCVCLFKHLSNMHVHEWSHKAQHASSKHQESPDLKTRTWTPMDWKRF